MVPCIIVTHLGFFLLEFIFSSGVLRIWVYLFFWGSSYLSLYRDIWYFSKMVISLFQAMQTPTVRQRGFLLIYIYFLQLFSYCQVSWLRISYYWNIFCPQKIYLYHIDAVSYTILHFTLMSIFATERYFPVVFATYIEAAICRRCLLPLFAPAAKLFALF